MKTLLAALSILVAFAPAPVLAGEPVDCGKLAERRLDDLKYVVRPAARQTLEEAQLGVAVSVVDLVTLISRQQRAALRSAYREMDDAASSALAGGDRRADLTRLLAARDTAVRSIADAHLEAKTHALVYVGTANGDASAKLDHAFLEKISEDPSNEEIRAFRTQLRRPVLTVCRERDPPDDDDRHYVEISRLEVCAHLSMLEDEISLSLVGDAAYLNLSKERTGWWEDQTLARLSISAASERATAFKLWRPVHEALLMKEEYGDAFPKACASEYWAAHAKRDEASGVDRYEGSGDDTDYDVEVRVDDAD